MPPIGVFCYNRPLHLQAALAALEKSMLHLGSRLPLYIFCDGAKHPLDPKVEHTRQVARHHPHAQVIEREKNFGFKNITEGVSQLCAQYGHAIIIEDDVLVAPDFLSYMTSALTYYANDPRVFVISGFMYFDAQPNTPPFFFLPQQFIWGWGTWKRAWDHYQWSPEGWEETLRHPSFKRYFDCFNSIKFSKMLEKTMRGIWNTWDIQWMFCQARAGGLTLFPHRSLVWNCGSGGGTHGDMSKDAHIHLADREYYIHGTLTLEDFASPRLQAPFQFPETAQTDFKAMRYLASTFLQEWQRRDPRWKWTWKLWLNRIMTLITPRPKSSSPSQGIHHEYSKKNH